MPNMSYCRFENTSTDLADCVETITSGEADLAELNEYERAGLQSIVRNAKVILEMLDDGVFDAIGVEAPE